MIKITLGPFFCSRSMLHINLRILNKYFFDIDKARIVLHEKLESSRNKLSPPPKILFYLFYHLG